MVSIIVPVYNCREYLEKCVGSVFAQTYRDWELILVNDGSSDGSGALCDALAARDPRVRVLHQENRGVSAARNAGLDAARGDYLCFVDADDWVVPEMLEKALACLGDGELVMFDLITTWPNSNEEPDTIPLLMETCKIDRTMWTSELLRYMAGSACRCLYRRSLVEGQRFVEGLKMSEDRLFNLEAMGRARSVRYLKRGLYYRFMRPGSACNRYHGDKLEQNLLAWQQAVRIIESYWTPEYLPVYARMLVIGGALDAIYEICSTAFTGDRLAAIREITENTSVREAFLLSPPRTLREKLLAGRYNAWLLVVGKLYCIKHRGAL